MMDHIASSPVHHRRDWTDRYGNLQEGRDIEPGDRLEKCCYDVRWP
jgi:hypothetical protein